VFTSNQDLQEEGADEHPVDDVLALASDYLGTSLERDGLGEAGVEHLAVLSLPPLSTRDLADVGGGVVLDLLNGDAAVMGEEVPQTIRRWDVEDGFPSHGGGSLLEQIEPSCQLVVGAVELGVERLHRGLVEFGMGRVAVLE